MRVAAMVLGLIGGIIGLLVALLHGIVGVLAGASSEGSHNWLAWLTLACAIVGIAGAAIVLSKARTGSILLLVAGLVGFVGSSAFWLVSGILLLLAAVFAFLGRNAEARRAASPQVR